MVFDDSFFQLTGGRGLKENKEGEKKAGSEAETVELDELLNSSVSESELAEGFDTSEKKEAPKERVLWPGSELGNPEMDYVIESDIVTPKITRVRRESERPVVMVIDDDFELLDLLKIFLIRNYDYKPFSGPREAIFFLNEHVPDIIFLDSNIHTLKAPRVVDIIRSYSDLKNVPIVYVCDASEVQEVSANLPESVSGYIERPVARGKLQEKLDELIVIEEETEEEASV